MLDVAKSCEHSINDDWQYACGKVILFGEHAVVYGVQAIAGAIPKAMRARATLKPSGEQGRRVSIPAWSIDLDLHGSRSADLVNQTFEFICSELAVSNKSFDLLIEPSIPHAAGLGASAAVAVASIKAIAHCFGISIDNPRVNEIAYGCEKLAHGSPSGLDNTLATYGGLMTFQRDEAMQVHFEPIQSQQAIPLLVALSGKKGFTAETVARVRQARDAEPAKYKAIFAEVSALTSRALGYIERGQVSELALLFNENQVCLQDIGVSCVEIDNAIAIAMRAGASGAKLTGSGDGGAVLIYTEQREAVAKALNLEGFKTLMITL